MLSDHERRTLRKIQRELSTDDPVFAQSFDASDPPTRPYQALHERALVRWLLVAGPLVFAMLSLAIGTAGGAGLFAVIAVVAAAWQFLYDEQEKQP